MSYTLPKNGFQLDPIYCIVYCNMHIVCTSMYAVLYLTTSKKYTFTNCISIANNMTHVQYSKNTHSLSYEPQKLLIGADYNPH